MTLVIEVIRRKDSIVAAGRARFGALDFTANTGIPVPVEMQAPSYTYEDLVAWVRHEVQITSLAGFVSNEDEIVRELVSRIA